jgi:hypothetical protein
VNFNTVHTATARPRSFGFPPRPKTIAQTMLDLPDPLGPIIRFRLGPALNTTFLNVLQRKTYVSQHNTATQFLVFIRCFNPYVHNGKDYKLIAKTNIMELSFS